MHLRTTNKSAKTLDVHRFCFGFTSALEFDSSKSFAVVAGVLGMFVWYGFFIIVGEGYFHMWQTEIGLGSVEGAFRYGTVCAALLFYISFRDH